MLVVTSRSGATPRVPTKGVIGQLILSLKCSVPSRVVPLGPGVWRKTLVVYSLDNSGQRVDSPSGPRRGPIAIHDIGSTVIDSRLMTRGSPRSAPSRNTGPA